MASPPIADWQQRSIRIADDVKVWPVRERGEPMFRIEIPTTHRFYRLGWSEYMFVSALDGHRTLAQACGIATAQLAGQGKGRLAATSQQCEVIARWLIDNQIAHLADDPPPRRDNRPNELKAGSKTAKQPGWWTRLNPFWVQMPLPGADRLLRRTSVALGPLISTPVVLAGCLVIVTALIGLLLHRREFMNDSITVFDPSHWWWLLASVIGLKLVHELGHAVACHRHGGTVHRAGIVWVLLAPLAYVDVSSCWGFASRRSRMAVAVAGMFVESLIAAVAAWGWLISSDESVRWMCHHLVLTAGVSTVVFNANVLMRFDGYFLLSDLMDVPNLATEASQSVRQFMRRWLLGDATWVSSHTGWRRGAVFAYGCAAMIWRVLVCVSLAIAASTLLGGAGVLLSVVGAWMWFGKPVVGVIASMNDLRRVDPPRFVRGIILGSFASGITAWILIGLPIPSSVRVPVVVQYDRDASIRSGADGFVTQVHVHEGDVVKTGDRMIEIENRELTQQVRELEISLQQNSLRLRKAIGQRDDSLRVVLSENATAIEQKLATLRQQTDRLRVVAPRDGEVIGAELDSLRGRYVNEGDLLLFVASSSDKELMAVVDQRQMDDVRTRVGTDVRLVAPGCDRLIGRWKDVQPRASDRVPDASLAATNGGPLAVRTQEETDDKADRSGETALDSLRLLEPHFRGTILVDMADAERLPVGMRLEAHVGWHKASIASRFQRWFERTLARAKTASLD